MADASILHGETNCLTIALHSEGNENALGLSICFDTNLLTYAGISRGQDALGGSLLVNATQADSGSVGLALSLGFDEVFTPGSNVVAQICFRAAQGIPTTSTVVRLCDEPIAREIADVNAGHLSAIYGDAIVSIAGICAFALGAESATVSSEGGEASVSVFTEPGCAWSVLNTNDWISIDGPTNGTGGGTIIYRVQPNLVPARRVGVIEIGGRPFTITQAEAPCTFQLSPTGRVHDYPSVGDTFDVVTFDNCYWEVINTNDWILIKLFTNGIGSGMVRYTVLANLDPHVREGNIVVGGQPFRVIQRAAPCTYNILPASRVVSPSGAAGQITILTANDCSWSMENTNLWISLGGPMAGKGNAVINYTVAPRFALQERSGIITIADQKFAITQLGTPCAYSISPTRRSHSSGRSTSSITVNTNNIEECATLTWTATTTNPWIYIVAGSNGIGRGTVRYTVTNHTIGGTRTGIVLVADRIFTITQSGRDCDFSRSPSSRSHSYLAETGFVNVTAFTGCVWTATSSQPWVTITSDPNGNGNGRITYLLQTNTGSSRSATLRFGPLSFRIEQGSATSPSISSRPGNQNVLGGATVVFNVTASGTAPLSYQWRFNGTNLVDGPGLSGATTPRLTLSNIQPHQAGNYTVVVSNIRGSTTSSAAVLRVNTPPVLDELPLKVVNRGSLLAFRPVVLDSDIPPQTMRYSLLSAPSGASINSSSGLFTWTPGSSQAAGTNFATIRVVDNGSPALAATQRVTIVVIAAPTTNLSLIATGSVWKYNDTGQDLGSAWTSLLFDDSDWRGGPAPLGYGLSRLLTTVRYGPSSSSRYITTYFRQLFSISEPRSFTSLNLRVRRDDGVVLYLNGTEIYRNNMPSGPIGYRTLASSSASSSSSFTSSAADASSLVEGINVLAAEIHQQSAGSSDIVFDLGLTGVKTFIAPSIVTHPTTRTVPEGGAVQLAVVVNGLPPMAFQWWFDGTPLAWATNSTLELSELQLAQSGLYHVTVTNASGAVTSSPAHLTVFKVINTPPKLEVVDDLTATAGIPLALQVIATDTNDPPQQLLFSLAPGAPAGARIDPDTGAFSWTPSDVDAGNLFPVTVRVTDNGSPPASDFTSFTITVLERPLNAAPNLQAIASRAVSAGELVSFTALATDADLPGQTLRFTLAPGAPAAATINAASGAFSWRTATSDAGSTNEITVQVTDNGIPPLGHSQTFTVWVLPSSQTNLTLIPSNSVWRFRDTGENLGSAWREPGYNDTSWRSGPGTLGYGGKYIRTTVSYGPSSSSRYITTYFRRSFSVGNPGVLGPLRLRVRRDDGVAVYLNGTEVHRDNLPAGTITYLTTAPLNMDAEDELTYFPAPPIAPGVLVPGENVLAVEVHQKSVGSSDLSFDLELTSTINVLPPGIVTQPQSQSVLEGQEVTLNVIAVGTPPLRYRWYFNGSAVPNATNATLQINSVELSAKGDYFVVVTNVAGSITSTVATLSVQRVRGVSLAADEVIGNAGDNVLIPVRVAGFTNINSFQFSLRWDPNVAQWLTNEQFAFPNISFGTNDIAAGIMAVSWDEADGASRTLAPGALLFAPRLRLVGNAGTSTSLLITNSPTPIEIADQHLDIVPVSVVDGRVSINFQAESAAAGRVPAISIALGEEGVRLSWNAVPGTRYRLEACSALGEPWVSLGETLASSEASFAMDFAPLARQRIYRVVRVENTP